MKTLIFLVVTLLATIANAQTTVVYGTKLFADAATVTVTDGVAEISAEGLKSDLTKSFVELRSPSDYDNGWILIYEQGATGLPDFLPLTPKVELTKPGTFDILILPSNGDAPTKLEGIIVGKSPVEPGEPTEPPPSGDFSDLPAIIKATLPNDADTAKRLEQAFLTADGDSVQNMYGDSEAKRKLILQTRQNRLADWTKFVEAVDREVVARKVKTKEQLKEFFAAIVEGLKSVKTEKIVSDLSFINTPQVWTQPTEPATVGTIHNGRMLIKKCFGDHCEYVWVQLP